MHAYMPENFIFYMGPITDLLSVLSALIDVILSVHAKGQNSLNDLKCGTFTGRFPIDGATSMAGKGLNSLLHHVCLPDGDDNEKVCLRCSARSCTCGVRMKRTDYLSGLDAFKVIAVTGIGGRGGHVIF